MRHLPFLLLTLLLALTPGCCNCPREPQSTLPLPPPISLQSQVAQLNSRAAQLETLRARGRVSIDYADSAGSHSYQADGSLFLRQQPTSSPPRADLVLFGRFAGQDVFELGVNSQTYWMAIRVDPKRAFVGPASPNPDPEAPSLMPFRPDRLLPLLAITPLAESPATHLLMTIDDAAGTNTLLVVRTPPNAFAWIERSLTINRRTGHVDEVRLFRPSGLVEAIAQLQDYQPLDPSTDEEQTPSQSPNLRLPRRILLDYPSRKARVELRLDSTKRAPKLAGPSGDHTFEMPDFKSQGLEVINAEPQG